MYGTFSQNQPRPAFRRNGNAFHGKFDLLTNGANVNYGMARPSENIEYDVSLLKGKEPGHADFHIGYRHREEQLQCRWR